MLKRFLLAGALIIWFAAAIATPTPAGALPLNKNGFSAKDIKLSNIRYEIDRINLSTAEISVQGSGLTADDSGRLLVAPDSCKPGEQDVDGSAVYTWRSCGTDANNDRIDVHLTLQHITIMNPYPDVQDASLLLLDDGFGVYDRPKQGGASLQAIALRPDENGTLVEDAETRLGVSVEVGLRITKTGTDTPAQGTFLFSMRGLNGVDADMPTWSEQVDLAEGFSDTVFVLPESTLTATQDNTRFTTTGGDEESYAGGFVTTSDPGQTVFRWTGRGCRQLILDNFSPARVILQTNGHGSAMCEGINMESMWPLEWGGDEMFTFAPDDGYDNPRVTVNGQTLGSYPGWSCTNSIIDINLKLEFTPYKYQIRYEFGWGSGTGSMPLQTAYGDQTVTIQDCSFAREGYVFTGWNTNRSGTGVSYHPGQQVINLATRFNRTVYLYAQWEPVITVRVPTEAVCRVQADGTVISPSGWSIENLSEVAVRATTIEASDVVPEIGIALSNAAGQRYFQHEPNGEVTPSNNTLKIKAGANATCTWSLKSSETPWGTLNGKGLQSILNREDRPGTVGDVTFTFERP